MALWTNEEDAIMLEMIKAGNSASIIAEKLGRTRNAVIGRSHRLVAKKGDEARLDVNRLVAIPAIAIKNRKPTKTKVNTRDVEDRPELPKMIESLLALRHDQCRWPLEDGFCQHQKIPNSPYCAKHTRMAFRPRP